MSIKKKYYIFFNTCILLAILTNFCFSQDDNLTIQNPDTIQYNNEYSLDSIKINLSGNTNRIDKISKDTIVIRVGDKFYKIPLKVYSTAILTLQKNIPYFKLTGLSLYNDSLGNYIRNLFRNPREYLKDSIPAVKWKNSDIYNRYFKPYDAISRKKEIDSNNVEEGENELEQIKKGGKGGYIEQNYEEFPLPQTIDIEVDLTKSPREIIILGLPFNFDKLENGFQELIYKYSMNKNYNNRRSYEKKNEKY